MQRKEKKSKIKRIIFIAIGILVLIVVAVCVVRFFSGEDNWICSGGKWVKHGYPIKSMPTSGCGNVNSEVKNTESTNLKTYTNSKYGFSFQYPGNWTIKENNNPIFIESDKNYLVKNGITGEMVPTPANFNITVVDLDRVSGTTKQNAQEYIQQQSKLGYKTTIKQINGILWTEIEVRGLGNVLVRDLFTNKGNVVYQIDLSYGDYNEDKSNLNIIERDLYNIVLASLKFTN